MINTKDFYDYLIKKDLSFFVGVPDSLLKNLCSCITTNSNKENNIIAANEGNAIGIASGYHLATKKSAVVYMQNSGIGNTVNPLLSLCDEDVYNIPMLMIIGYRGEPGVKDEPQHVKQGVLTIPLLETMGIKYMTLDSDYESQIDECYNYMNETNKPIALIVKKDSFDTYKMEKEKTTYTLTREESLEEIISNLNEDDLVVSTTGKTSREIYEVREKLSQNHDSDFLTVGSMGHTSSIAFGLSLNTDRNVFCIDGDGSLIMHMGGLAIAAQNAKNNFKYILINNGSHESVGGQPTIGFEIDFEKILLSFGFDQVIIVNNIDELKSSISKFKEDKLTAVIINTKTGSRDDLGRPKIKPVDNKINMMNNLVK